MSISAVAQGGLDRAQASLVQAVNRISNPDNLVDAVSLSSEAVALSQAHTQFSVAIKTLQVADEIDKTAISITG